MGRKLKNQAERAFQEWAEHRGITVSKRGWPDFFCLTADGIMLVEVKKTAKTNLKRSQRLVLTRLARFGIPCFRWDPDDGLTPV